MSESPLLIATDPQWSTVVVENFDDFLLDHAAAEKKASGMAMSMVSHYPDRELLVSAMVDLAIEELNHYREVVKWIHSRGLQTGADSKDPYVLEIRKAIRQSDNADIYLMDRLLTAGIIEARGAERFGLVADALEDDTIAQFYHAIARSEQRHYTLFLELAEHYLPKAEIDLRWHELLAIEAEIVQRLPLRAALH